MGVLLSVIKLVNKLALGSIKLSKLVNFLNSLNHTVTNTELKNLAT